MKVIFLDFDGVLNSAASFMMEGKKREGLNKAEKAALPMRLNETLCDLYCANFQFVLDRTPDAKIVISSTWRELYTLDWLKAHLKKFGIDGDRVIDRTPGMQSYTSCRGDEIDEWLTAHPEVTHFAIIDDNPIGNGYEEAKCVIETSWLTGFTLPDALKTIELLDGDDSTKGIPL